MGTVAYMSPEQARGEELDARTDLFSFGVVLYEMATGRQPFTGDTSAVIFDAILNRTPVSPGRLNPELPTEFEHIINKALEKDRKLRYQTASDLRTDLQRLRRDTESGRVAGVVGAVAERKTVEAVRPRRFWIYASSAFGALFLLVVGLFLVRTKRPLAPAPSEWVQLTNFTDFATSPALSPDGRMLAFIRGPDTWVTAGQIYIKLLPNGDPVQLTRDDLPKGVLVFTPDGSRIAYTVPWDTWVVPALGGEPQHMLANASGLTWIDEHHLLFSEVKKGIHMAIVTASDSRAEERDIYIPADERGMAHRSYLSPDGKWVLLVEMDSPGWLPCRIVPFDGSSQGRRVGPLGAACTSAAWSPDGKWMYLNSDAGGTFHLWRQRFAGGEPEQITSGVTEEEGIAMAADGRSLVTSVGTEQSAVWFHDSHGDHQISSEGSAGLTLTGSPFSPDGKKLYYPVRRGSAAGSWSVPGELWAAEIGSGRSERLLPGFSIANYDVSPDGKRVVFDALGSDGKQHIWLAWLDRRFPPRQLTSGSGEFRPTFDRSGNVYFTATDGNRYFAHRMREDGTRRGRLVEDPVIAFYGISPDGEWVVALAPASGEESSSAVMAYPTSGGPPIRACDKLCFINWTPDAKYLYVSFPPYSAAGTHGEESQRAGKTYVIPLKSSKDFAILAARGFKSGAQLSALPGVRVIDHWRIHPGPLPLVYAFTETTVHRNLYRILLP